MSASKCLARFLRSGLAVLLLLPGLACADVAVVPPDPQTVDRQIDTAPNRGMLYQVTDGNNKLYLFGTIHLGKPEFYPLNRQVINAVRSSNVLAVEVDVTDQQASAKLIADVAMYPATDTLDKHISPELMQKIRRVLQKYGFPWDMARQMKPWMLALTLDYVGGNDVGYSPQWGADVFLLGLAKGLHKPVAEVESMQFQIHLFESMAPEEQEGYLASTVDSLESGEFRTEMTGLVEAWANADGAAIAKSIEEGEAALPPEDKWIMTKLIRDRNSSMTKRVEEYLHSGSQYFVAVGAGHLVGSDGIVARLKAKGYKVRDLQ